jgi:ribose/xylose/arabinose/galactoside ABC-type transport system permease subunit
VSRIRLADPDLRPYLIFLCTFVLLALIDIEFGRFLTRGTAFSTAQLFATLAPVTLGLSLTMMVREYDISVAGMFSLAGCVAVATGADNPVLGLALALVVGAVGGFVQALIMIGLRLSSLGVTLGGLLTFSGLAYVMTENRALNYPNMDVALLMNEQLVGIFSIRSLSAIALFLVAALIMAYTRVGRDVIGMGSDRRAALIAGVNTDRILIGVFTLSGMLAALSGSLLAYSLATASPSGLSDVLVPATAAAILGGVSLSGGTGKPLGIAFGVLVLCLLRAGLNAVGASPHVQNIATGAVLIVVAISDGPALARRAKDLRHWFRGRRAEAAG